MGNLDIRYLAFTGILIISGCAAKTRTIAPPTRAFELGQQCLYHIVAPGETVWSICRNYGIKVDSLVELNKLADPSKIEVGQILLLPEAAKIDKIAMGDGTCYFGKSEPFFIKPAPGGAVVSYFGNTVNGKKNKGIDFSYRGKVIAPKTGKVVFFANSLKGYGNVVIIDHGDGYASVMASKANILVASGQVIRQGEPVFDSSGSQSILHFEIRRGATPVNPLSYIKK